MSVWDCLVNLASRQIHPQHANNSSQCSIVACTKLSYMLEGVGPETSIATGGIPLPSHRSIQRAVRRYYTHTHLIRQVKEAPCEVPAPISS